MVYFKQCHARKGGTVKKQDVIEAKEIIFFDGVCGLCNQFVDILVKCDHLHRYRFAPLQGETAAHYLSKTVRTELNTLVFYKDKKILYRSEAVLEILMGLGGWWRYCRVLTYCPRFLRDLVYTLVAQFRYKLFSRRKTCRLPSREEKQWFLK